MNADRIVVAAATGTNPLGESLIDAAAVAEYLGVDRTTVYRLVATCEIPAIDVAPRVVRFRPADVRAFVERRTRKASSRGRVKSLLGDAPCLN